MKLLTATAISLCSLAAAFAYANEPMSSSGSDEHWHGATAINGMTHLAIQGQLDGKSVNWLEKVSDEQHYGSATALLPVRQSEDVRRVALALERYTQGLRLGELWKRPDLSPRDRSSITVAVLIARNQTIEMPAYFNRALDGGVKPSGLSETITHLAFYSGWPNVFSAIPVVKGVVEKRPR